MPQLSDYCRSKVATRIKKSSPLCCLKSYKKTEITNDVTRVSYQISYNAGGHALFGILTLGMASIAAESSKMHFRYFDTSTGDYLGQTTSEAEAFYNNKCDCCVDKSDLVTAEKYLSKLYGLCKSEKNLNKYQFIQNLNEISLNMEQGKIEDATALFQRTADKLNLVPKKLAAMYESFKVAMEKYNSQFSERNVENVSEIQIEIPMFTDFEEHDDMHWGFDTQIRLI